MIERNQVRQNRAQSCVQLFGDDFDNEIAKSNRLELLHFSRVTKLGYKYNA